MKIANLYSISSAGLAAQRKRIDSIVQNIANANTKGYKYQKVVLESIPFSKTLNSYMEQKDKLSITNSKPNQNAGTIGFNSISMNQVKAKIIEVANKTKIVYDVNHPEADENGYVELPDINIVSEMADLLVASRAYEANLAALNAAKEMDKEALKI
jgi:flagellar basal-body rod protein FlgC